LPLLGIALRAVLITARMACKSKIVRLDRVAVADGKKYGDIDFNDRLPYTKLFPLGDFLFAKSE